MAINQNTQEPTLDRRALIVNADDYARTPGVSAGIREAHREGIVTSTSVMMNLPGAAQAVREARSLTPGLGLGVHLTLTAGQPLRPGARGLTLPGGHFPRPEAFMQRLPALNLAEVEAEWRAQIEAMLAFGARPDHLDSHHHTSYLSPGLFGTMLDLAAEYRCAVRNPLPHGPAPMDFLSAPVTREMLAAGPVLLAAVATPRPDHFLAGFFGPAATLETLLDLLRSLPPGVSELMCHPGHADAELLAASGYAHEREAELAILTDPRPRAIIEVYAIRLATFSDLLHPPSAPPPPG